MDKKDDSGWIDDKPYCAGCRLETLDERRRMTPTDERLDKLKNMKNEDLLSALLGIFDGDMKPAKRALKKTLLE